MNYPNHFYQYIPKLIKEFLKNIRYTVSSLRSQNRDRFKKQQRTLEVLSSLSYRTGELKEYLQLVANGVGELLGLDWAVVTLCRKGFESILASSIDIGDLGVQPFAMHGTLTEAVINAGSCLFVENTAINKQHGEPPQGYVAYLGAPLRLPTGEIIGTICSFHRRPRKFTQEEMQLVEIFAERAATAIDNYNLYQKQQEVNLALQAEIKERQEVEQELRKSEEQLRLIAENLEPIVWLYSHDGKPIYMSPMFEKVWGIPVEQWYEDGSICINSVVSEDREMVAIAFKNLFSDGSNYNLEYRIIQPNGSIRIIRDQAFPIVDKNGQIYRVAGLAEDITDSQLEQQRTIKAMARLSEIGELATTIIHEVRNPLTTVLMGLNYFYRMELPEGARKRLSLALDEAERLKRLLNQILLYAKHEVIQPVPIDMNKLAMEIIENLSITQTAIGRQIVLEVTNEPFIVQGDKDKLTQVLINLLQNACEAVTEGEKISVSFSFLISSHQICLQIQNRCAPIPAEILANLTKPFITTKPDGNGLGLAIVKKIVEAHGGKLEIDSSAIAVMIIKVLLPI